MLTNNFLDDFGEASSIFLDVAFRVAGAD